MGLLSWLVANSGLAALTVLAVALTGYLVYAMLHPEEF
jgi:K+-transporting ATPase KdpF subunit